jgi:hypothetical protein
MAETTPSGKTIVLPEGENGNDGFFQIGNPSSPAIKLQFRTNPDNKANKNTDYYDDKWWEEIVDTSGDGTQEFQFQNYLFKSATIEDNGGVQSLTLEMSDQNIAELERILISCSIQDQFANSGVDETAASSAKSMSEGWLRYFIGKTMSTHIRLRIGYSQDIKMWSQGNDNIINEAIVKDSFEEIAIDPWSKRSETPEKTVIMSPWFYFMIQNIDSKYTFGSGFSATIKAFSSSGPIMNKFKIVQQYAVIKSTPEKIVGSLFSSSKGSIVAGFDNNIKFYYQKDEGKDPVPITNGSEIDEISKAELKPIYRTKLKGKKQPVPDDKREIELSLGRAPSSQDGKYILEYKTLSEILNDFCSKAPTKNTDKDGNSVPSIIEGGQDDTLATPSKESDVQQTFKKDYISTPLRWKVSQLSDGTYKVTFFYTSGKGQEKIRKYQFNGTGLNLIKNMDVQGVYSMWANLNMPLLIEDNGIKRMISLTPNAILPNSSDVTSYDESVKYYQEVKRVTEQASIIFNADNFDASKIYVNAGTFGNINTQGTISDAIARNLNQQSFRGSIDIVGDPFYFFSQNINPYFYSIYLKVDKTDYFKKDGTFQPTYESPVTGEYTVNKITHKIDTSGYTTTLEISKFPIL